MAPKAKKPAAKATPPPPKKKSAPTPVPDRRDRASRSAEKRKAPPAAEEPPAKKAAPAKPAPAAKPAAKAKAAASAKSPKPSKPAKAAPKKAAPKKPKQAKAAPKGKGIKKAAPRRAAKPAAKAKAKDAVIAVDAIIGIKFNKAGKASGPAVLYQIKWEGGDVTWEPEANIMDDDLVDDFEAGLQAEVYSKQKISAGDSVEVKNEDEGFQNSWSGATVVKKAGKKDFEVEYTAFVDSKGKKLSEKVDKARLRLSPDDCDKGWAPVPGEIVEISADDCWWEARVLELAGKGAKVMFRVSDETKSVPVNKKMRPCNWLKVAAKGK
ncbi:hypothetical protein EMIHUDRAFT_450507 [Emiliania huxleyi CCMP1516]|uniref:Chromo domain-containing protein n=2 Tax=Emiliania huxleyi TaxID=2903 RepID=A0A0D3JM02_EMIH1|nr:hypothetical protein EMIHUDRAFT_450507 [Emiliania huxleyi CCMP1516]EOD24537.1 hypothetical protein EMIHUDRAFT_450507 [Emiliania huxleyi CCMP1516]|eukprot:XP_005776966.1 hypothetical protein EMIHUDRAFT_450507 [Emiliania huxleyi CCMP1516]